MHNTNLIVINGRFLSQRLTGIQRFAYEICCALKQIGVPIVILAPNNIDPHYNIQDLPVIPIGGQGSHFWEQVTLPRYMRKHYNGRILLSLSGFSPLCYNRNILTIHDISYLLRPRSYSWLYCTYYRLLTPLIAKRAKKILTVSNFSKDELIHILHLPAEKIEVVYNAVRPAPLLPQTTQDRFILAVGSQVPRKNLKRLFEAYCSMPEPDFDLYLAGGTHAIYANAELTPYQNRKGVHLLDYVHDKDLAQLYRNATAFVNPSLYEGFGIPNIEAMQQHCPLVVSDIPAFREVCGEAALYFDPTNIADIQAKLDQIMHDEALRQQLADKGDKQCLRFDWNQSAQVIQSVINTL